MVRLLAAALVVGYLPGAVMFRLPGGNRPARTALPAEERLFWAVIISAAWSLAVVLALAFFRVYSFERLIWTNVAAALVLGIGFRQRLTYAPPAPRASWPALVPAGIVALGAWLYFPTAEYVIGGKDPGTYINEGIQIAQRGSLVVRDSVVASVPPAVRDLFFPSHGRHTYYGLRFVGFYIQDPNDGSVVGQFPHLLPAAIAVGYGLNGLSGARQAVAVWAILGLLAVYFAAAHLVGRTAAAAAVVLLAIHVIVVWFARYPNSEVMMQALVFAALAAFVRAVDGSAGFFGPVAGALVGLMLFLRYDAVLAVGAFAAAAALLPVLHARIGPAFPVVLVLATLIGFLYLLGPLKAYASFPLEFMARSGGWWTVGGGLAGLVLGRAVLKRPDASRLARRAIPVAYGVALVGLAVYAYFFRRAGGGLAPFDAMSLRVFAWYVPPVVLAASVVGALVMGFRRFWRQPAFFITFAVFSVFFFYKTRIVPEHFWTTRRFIAVTLPGVLILVAGLAAMTVGREAIERWTNRERWRAIPRRLAAMTGPLLVLAVLAPVGVVFWRQSAPVRQHVEYAGLIPKLESLAGRVGDRDLLLVESRNAGSDLHMLALPLAYIYARNVLVLNSPVPEKRLFEDFIGWARTRYEEILFLGGGGTDLLTARLAAEPIGGDRFQVPEYAAPLHAYPSGVRRKEFEYGLYRLVSREAPPRGPIDLTIGFRDDLHVVRFHARELRPDTGMTFRWTGEQSFVLLLGIAPDASELTMWLSNGGRPPSAPPAQVEVAIGDRLLGTAVPEDEVRPYRFPLPADLVTEAAASPDPIRLRLRVPTWKPSALLGVSDTRDLGVMVTRVTVR
jgi:hypothetical protein